MSLKNLVVTCTRDIYLPLIFGVSADNPPKFIQGTVRDKNELSGNKKIRRTEKPNQSMRVIQNILLKELRALQIPMPYAMAFKPGASAKKDVLLHRRSRFFCLMDLKDAYRHVDLDMLVDALIWVCPDLDDCRTGVKEFLERYCLSRFGGLPMGAPASPDLFNIYCDLYLDSQISTWCFLHGYIYSRYGDDVTISSSEKPVSRKIRGMVIRILEDAGFSVNTKKGKFHLHDLWDGSISIHGIRLEAGGRIFVPRHFRRHLSKLLVQAVDGVTDWRTRAGIEGRMGLFRHITDSSKHMKAESSVFSLYTQFRRLFVKKKKVEQ